MFAFLPQLRHKLTFREERTVSALGPFHGLFQCSHQSAWSVDAMTALWRGRERRVDHLDLLSAVNVNVVKYI